MFLQIICTIFVVVQATVFAKSHGFNDGNIFMNGHNVKDTTENDYMDQEWLILKKLYINKDRPWQLCRELSRNRQQNLMKMIMLYRTYHKM